MNIYEGIFIFSLLYHKSNFKIFYLISSNAGALQKS
jgi:hypothetical protein